MMKKIWNTFLRIFGDIKVYNYPFFLVYDPGSYKIKGKEVRKILEIIKPGDILVRGYSNYLDGRFIPGFFSHVGLFVGDTTDIDIKNLKNNTYFYSSSQAVIHSMAEGVFMEDILDFTRCDYICILRRNINLEQNIDIDNDFKQNVLPNALNNLGKGYDFDFDFSDLGNMSCTEFVFDSCKNFIDLYNVKIKKHSMLFLKRMSIIPDDFITDKFNIIYTSEKIPTKIIDQIVNRNLKHT